MIGHGNEDRALENVDRFQLVMAEGGSQRSDLLWRDYLTVTEARAEGRLAIFTLVAPRDEAGNSTMSSSRIDDVVLSSDTMFWVTELEE